MMMAQQKRTHTQPAKIITKLPDGDSEQRTCVEYLPEWCAIFRAA